MPEKDKNTVSLDPKERPILMDIIEDRHSRKSMIITSQIPVGNWYEDIGDPTMADAMMDRIVHSALRIELTGESLRKTKAKKNNYSNLKMTPSAMILLGVKFKSLTISIYLNYY